MLNFLFPYYFVDVTIVQTTDGQTVSKIGVSVSLEQETRNSSQKMELEFIRLINLSCPSYTVNTEITMNGKVLCNKLSDMNIIKLFDFLQHT